MQVLNRHYRRHLDVGVQPEEETLGDTRDLGTICYVHDEMTGALAALSIEVRGLWFEILGKLLKNLRDSPTFDKLVAVIHRKPELHHAGQTHSA